MATPVRDQLFELSPYEGFDLETAPGDMQGWNSDHPLLDEVVRSLRPLRICEIGTWKGRSAINIARAVRENGLDAEIVCVDTWLGSPEHWLRPQWRASLRLQNGFPRLYETFLGNVIRSGFADIITPLPMTSESAADVFLSLGISFDFIYIDAAHEHGPVKRDLEAYWPLLSNPGILLGDDYIEWPGVTQAANEFAKERGLALFGERAKFLMHKGEIIPKIILEAAARVA